SDYVLRRHGINSELRKSKTVLSQNDCRKSYFDVLDYLDSQVKN
ncbi:unnamed protein product, partial [marine sediment metagenome]